jgi:hypothetical protein
MDKRKIGIILYGFGIIYMFLFAIIGTGSLMQTLSTVTSQQLKNTVWAMDKPLFLLWAVSVPIGIILGISGAFVYTGIKKKYMILTGFGYLCVVLPMMIVFTRVYHPALFGIGGSIILIIFGLTVWRWMRNFETLVNQEKKAAAYQLIGYLFFFTASWFICGEFAPLRLKAFEGRNPPSPIEIMVYLLLAWIFFFLSHTSQKADH